MLKLGMFIAAADGEIEKEEVDHIASFLESQFLLDPPDVRRLEALKQVFLRQHPSIGGIGKRLKAALTAEQLESVGEFLVAVAAANGAIDKKEIAALRSAYRALGLEAKALERSLDDYHRRAKKPVEVQSTTESTDAGEAIPPRQTTGLRTVFKLDAALLERLMHETRQVATLLYEAMQEEKSVGQPAGAARTVPPPPPPDSRFDGLEMRTRRGSHGAMLSYFLATQTTSRRSFAATRSCLRGPWTGSTSGPMIASTTPSSKRTGTNLSSTSDS